MKVYGQLLSSSCILPQKGGLWIQCVVENAFVYLQAGQYLSVV